MIVREFLKNAKRDLRAANLEEVDAEHLLAHLLGLSRMELHNSIHVEKALASYDDPSNLPNTYRQLMARRLANEPIQYITGLAYFCDLTLQVGPGVLIPRPESELMIDRLLVHLESFSSPASVIDLGAGAGSLALAIATQSTKARVIAVEKDPAAVYWLRKNIETIGAEVRVVAEDVATALLGVKADVIIANPPYVPDDEVLPAEVQDFEPHVALFGGPDGMDIPRRFFTAAARLLKQNGLFVTEHGEDQGDEVAQALRADFHDVTLHRDLNQRPRWTSALRN
jgi:release factor glutamine methyltransferase